MDEPKVDKPKAEDMMEIVKGHWSIWEKEVSEFPWSYEQTEVCYIMEGKATVEYGENKRIHFAAGDMVTFPKGLECTWKIKEPIRKRYTFK